MSTALFYDNPRPLDAVRDADLKVREITDLSFARDANTIPINLVEFTQAARHYPIGFVGDAALPAAIVGLQKQNLFIDDEGLWKPGVYVPAFVRRYPFIFAETNEADQFSLCIDDDPRAVSVTQGRPLFLDGKPAPLINHALDFCRSFQMAARETDAFVKAIKKSGILVERKAETRLAEGASFTLAGFKAVDPERLRKLPARTLALWNEKNWLAPIFFHIQSMTNWNDLMELIPSVQANKADRAQKASRVEKAAKPSKVS
jgi:hypothetical protein